MKPAQPHENEDGYRYCALCETWKQRRAFALTALSHDGQHPICLLHVDESEAARRAERVIQVLSAACVDPRSRLKSR